MAKDPSNSKRAQTALGLGAESRDARIAQATSGWLGRLAR